MVNIAYLYIDGLTIFLNDFVIVIKYDFIYIKEQF